MVNDTTSMIGRIFNPILNHVEVIHSQKNHVDYYHIITEQQFNLIISFEHGDKKWNLYITYDKKNELNLIDYSSYKSLSGLKTFYKLQNKYVIRKAGFLKYILNKIANRYYLEFFGIYVKDNLEKLSKIEM